jgi:drug/metabolite transporter (DMT)-like permease
MNKYTGVALALLSGVCFAIFPVVGRYATQYEVSKVTQLAFRFLIGCLLVLPFVPRAAWRAFGVQQWIGFGAMGAMYVVQSLFYLMSIDRIPMAMTSILLYVYPAVVVLLSRVFLGEKITGMKIAALAAALVGAVATIGAPGTVRDSSGVWMALVTPTVYSAYIIVGAKVQRGISAAAASATVMGAAALLLFGLGAAAAVAAPDSKLLALQFDLPWQAWAALVAFGAVCTAPPVLSFLAAVQRIGASRTSILSTIELAATAVFGAALFGESLGPWQIIGGLLVAAAVILTAQESGKA